MIKCVHINNKKGFTLIEILVVVAIVVSLASIIIASVSSARESTRMSKAKLFAHTMDNELGSQVSGWWDFNECTGTTTKDTASNTNGSLSGTVTFSTDTPFGTGCSLSFVDPGYVSIGNVAAFDNQNAISVAAWVKTTSSATDKFIVVNGLDGFDGAGYSIRIRQGISAFAVYKSDSSGYWDLFNGKSIIDGNWHYIVGTFDTTKIRRYVDGVLEQEANTGQPYLTNSSNFRIGAGFTGLIDGVRVYTTTLSLVQIQKLYVEGLKTHTLVKK